MKLTNDDLNAFKSIVEIALEEKIDEKGLVTKKDLKYLPTKDEFYEETLKILKKLDDLEVEKDVLSSHSSNHTDRIEALEKLHPNSKHSLAISG